MYDAFVSGALDPAVEYFAGTVSAWNTLNLLISAVSTGRSVDHADVVRVRDEGWIHPDYDRCLDLIQQHGEAVDLEMNLNVGEDATLVWITNRFTSYRDMDGVETGHHLDPDAVFNLIYFFVTGVELDGLIFLDIRGNSEVLDDQVPDSNLLGSENQSPLSATTTSEGSGNESGDVSNDGNEDHLFVFPDTPPLLSSSPHPLSPTIDNEWIIPSPTSGDDEFSLDDTNPMDSMTLSGVNFQFPGLSICSSNPVTHLSEFDINPYWSEEDSQISDELGGFHFEDYQDSDPPW